MSRDALNRPEMAVRRVFAKANGHFIEITIPPTAWYRPISYWVQIDKTGGLRLAFYDTSKLVDSNGISLLKGPTQWPGLPQVYFNGEEPQGDNLLRDALAENDDNDLLAGELPSPAKKDGSRRKRKAAYTRSRTGCLNCRRRRSKCDEIRPQCRRCTTSGKTCDYSSDEFSNPILKPQIEECGGTLPDALAGGTDTNAIVIPADEDDDLRDAPCEDDDDISSAINNLNNPNYLSMDF